MSRFYLGVIAALVVLLLVREGCNSAALRKAEKRYAALESKAAGTKGTRIVDTVYQDTVIEKPVYVPNWRDTGSIRYVPKPYGVPGPVQYIDTSSRVWTAYIDTLAIPEEGGQLVLHDTASGSRITSRRPVWHLNQRTVVQRETVEKPARRQIFLGVNGSVAMRDSILAAGPSLMYLTRRGAAYEVGAQVDSRGRIIVGAGAKFLISLRRK